MTAVLEDVGTYQEYKASSFRSLANLHVAIFLFTHYSFNSDYQSRNLN